MILLNVTYVLDFMINIVAESILEDKELHFDIQHRHFHRNNSAIILMFKIKAHYVLEDNRKSEEMFVTFIRIDFTHDRHQLLVHVNNEVIQHLTATAEKMTLITSKVASKATLIIKTASPFTSSITSSKA